jgi:hypothetical protein
LKFSPFFQNGLQNSPIGSPEGYGLMATVGLRSQFLWQVNMGEKQKHEDSFLRGIFSLLFKKKLL